MDAAVAKKSALPAYPKRRRLYPRLALAGAVVVLPAVTAALLSRSFHAGIAFVLFLNMAVFALARPLELLIGFLVQLPLIPRWGQMLGVRVPDLMAPAAVLLFAGSLIRWLTDKEREPFKPVWFDVIAAVFLLLGRFEIYQGPVDDDLAKAYTRTILIPGLFYLSVRLLMLDRRRMAQMIRWQLAAGMLLAVIVIIEAALHRSFLYRQVSDVFQAEGLYQPGGAFGRPFLAGAYLALLLPLYLYGAMGGFGERSRGWFKVGAGLALVSIGLCMERGVWLAAAVGLFVLFLYRPLRRPAGMVLAVCAVLAGTGILLVSSQSWFQNRVAEQANVHDRLRFIQASFGILRSREWNWLTGIGEGGYMQIAYKYMPPRSYYEVDRRQEADKNRAQHNDFLRTLVEHGVPGASLLALAVMLVIGRGIRLARQSGRGEGYYDGALSIAMLAAACTVMVNGLTHNTLIESQIMSGFWLICGLLYSDRAMQKDTLSMLSMGQGRDDPVARSH
jgi:hypothetical protein